MTNYNDRKIRFAVVGCGHIGLRHAEMITRNGEAELMAMCDILPRDQIKSDIVRGVPYFLTIDEMLREVQDIDVVNVCTPNGLHAEHSLKALEHHKHVVCEKPMAITKADCEKIIYKALQVSRNVFGVMQNRYSPPSTWLKEVVEKNLLGDVYLVQLNCFWNRDDRYYRKGSWKGSSDLDGGTLFTQFSHFIDIMYWVFGDITDINGVFHDFCHQQSTAFEDTGIVNFRFVNGGMGSLNYTTAVYDTNLESSITVIGSRGSIRIGGQYMNEVVYCHIDGYTMPELPPANPANDYGAYKGSAANHHYIIENVIDTLKGRTTMTTNALEGLKVVEIIERIYALRKNNKPEIKHR